MTEQRGTLQRWSDEKGFGFIQPDGAGERLFVHISAMQGGVRPQQGQRVLFVPGQDAHGRPRAEQMRLDASILRRPLRRANSRAGGESDSQTTGAGDTRNSDRGTGKPRIQNLAVKLPVLAVLCVLPLAGSAQVLSAQGIPWFFLAYALASLLGFWLYWADKQHARNGRRRIPEKHLQIVALLGGWPGALLAQQALRHKTRKASFQIVFWAIVLSHQVLWADWLLTDSRHLTHWLPTLLG